MKSKELEERLSQVALYQTDGLPIREVLVVYWHPFSRWMWYVVEAEKIPASSEDVAEKQPDDDWLLFTWCQSGLGPDCDEWGYVLLSQLRDIPLITEFIPTNWQITKNGTVLK